MKFDADFGGARRAAVALRLFLCMASLALVPAAVIGYFSYLEARREIIDEKVYDMKQISKLRLGSVSIRIEDLKAHATRFAESQAAAGFINLPSYENFPSRLVERLSRNGFQGGAVLGLSGNLLAAADMANYDFFRREQWRTCAAGAAFDRVVGGAQFAASELSLDTPSGRRGMNFAVPIKNGDGKTAAVAMLYVDLARLQEAVAAESKNFRTSELFICAYVGGAPFIIAGANANGAMEPAFMGILAKTIEGAKISPDYKDSGYSLARDYKGNKVVAAWDYIPQLDWYVIMKTDLTEVLFGIQSLGHRVAILFLIVLPLSLCACAVFAKIFASPFSSLMKKVSGFAVADSLWEAPKSESRMLSASIDAMRDAVDDIASKSYAGASEVLAASEKLSGGTARRAELSRLIEASSDKIILHSRKISDVSVNLEHSVEQVDGVSEISVRQAEEALGGIEKMNRLMSGLGECAADFSGALGEIFEAGRKIGEIADSMTQLADRANLLSLNASIEAKKAGKSGSGFSVVADRLRKLADQTSTATLEIESMVKSISSLSDSGAGKVREFEAKFSDAAAQAKSVGEGLADIIQKIQGIPPRLVLLLDGIRAQSGEGDEISSRARELKRAVEDESKLIESAREICDTLVKTASAMRRESAKYSL